MNVFPDFSQHHYRIEKELGHNRAGGRVTYLAIHTETQQSVVIKQFQFAKSGASWSAYDTFNREIQLLKELNHPGIPRYLDTFQTDDGFCMIQEYKEATSLAVQRSFNPDAIRQIAIAALEILVYLQNRVPPVIHRDVKPDNILVDDQQNVYLVDFGFARVGEGEVGVSSVVKGTLGFMPPEQLFNRQLTEASDLYGLGMTLICLLTATQSDRIGDLVDISYRVSFKHLVPKLNIHWVNWLEKMVEPRLKDRFPNAAAALAAVPTSPLRPPEAQFSQSTIEFRVKRPGEQPTQLITVTNPIPDTMLEGKWEVAPHPHDPSPDRYRWVVVDPATFVGNQVECQITVDTRLLVLGKTYSRTLLLHANTLVKTYSLNLQIHTAPVALQSNWRSYSLLSFLCLSLIVISAVVSLISIRVGSVAEAKDIMGFGVALGSGIGLEAAAWILRSSGWHVGATVSTLAAVLVGAAVVLQAVTGAIASAGWIIVAGAMIGAIGGAIAGLALGAITEHLVAEGSQKALTIVSALLTALLGISLGLSWLFSVSHPLILSLLATSSLGLMAIVLHISFKKHSPTSNPRKGNRYLIKP